MRHTLLTSCFFGIHPQVQLISLRKRTDKYPALPRENFEDMVCSSAGIISMITMYAHSFAKNVRLTKVICGILVLLYLFIYSIIQMQDYALLMGSLGLFIVLGIVMFLSRKIDWYAVQTKEKWVLCDNLNTLGYE